MVTPVKAAKIVSTRAPPCTATMSPKPTVKKLTPEKYRASRCVWMSLKASLMPYQTKLHATISSATHMARRNSSDTGP